jgi:hypothetical protein
MTPMNDMTRAAEAVWVAAQQAPWASLALIPAETGLSVSELARAVAAVGSAQRGEPVEVVDAQSTPLAGSRSLAERVAAPGPPFSRVVAVDCPLGDQTGLLLARSAGAAVLVLALERTPVAEARRVLELVGPARFVGAVTLLASPR